MRVTFTCKIYKNKKIKSNLVIILGDIAEEKKTVQPYSSVQSPLTVTEVELSQAVITAITTW
jgi:hypothetical protein